GLRSQQFLNTVSGTETRLMRCDFSTKSKVGPFSNSFHLIGWISRTFVPWFSCFLFASSAQAQSTLTAVRVAYSALSAGIGSLWIADDAGIFRKHGLESNLVYIRGGKTAVQALLPGED